MTPNEQLDALMRTQFRLVYALGLAMGTLHYTKEMVQFDIDSSVLAAIGNRVTDCLETIAPIVEEEVYHQCAKPKQAPTSPSD